MKRKPVRAPKESLSDRVKQLTLRIEAMELREAALKQTMECFRQDSLAMQDLKEICMELKATMYVIFESICNFDDLLRPKAEESLRSKRMQFFNKV